MRIIETHSGPIYDIVPHPCFNQSKLGSGASEKLKFASCSSDGTARIWSCEKNLHSGHAAGIELSEPPADDLSPSWATGGTRWVSTSRIIRMDGGNSLKSASNSNIYHESEAHGQVQQMARLLNCLLKFPVSLKS